MNGLERPCLQPDGCSVVCAMDCACAHAENNITCLTLPFFSFSFFFLCRTEGCTRVAHKHTHSLSQADMCSAQPVITAALMWSLGGTEASYYCRFMTTFTLWLLPALPPFFPFPLSFSPSCARRSCAHSSPTLPTFHSIPPSPLRPNPHPSFFPLQRNGCCLFAVCKAILSHLWGKDWI